jgi:hypothetical protein
MTHYSTRFAQLGKNPQREPGRKNILLQWFTAVSEENLQDF